MVTTGGSAEHPYVTYELVQTSPNQVRPCRAE